MIKTKAMKTLLATALALFALGAAAAEPEIWRFYGYAYDLKSDRYLYTEVHEQHVEVEKDHWIKGSISYFRPDGQLFGRKTLDFSQDQAVPAYRMEQYDIGRIEAITDNGDPIQMLLKLKADKPEKTGSIPKKPMMTADSGFHMFIRAHFDELMRGDVVKFAFAVPAEFSQFKFKMQRVEDTTFEGKPAVRVKVAPATLLSFIVDPLELTYEQSSKRLLEFRGISNVHDPQTGKAHVVRITYASQPPEDAPKPLPPLGGAERR
jgi:hypothetical protein